MRFKSTPHFLFSISFHFESNGMKPLLQVKNSLVYNFDFSCLFVCVLRPVDLILIALGCIYSYFCRDRFSMFRSIEICRSIYLVRISSHYCNTRLKWKTIFDFSFPFQQYLVCYFFLCIVYLSFNLYRKTVLRFKRFIAIVQKSIYNRIY